MLRVQNMAFGGLVDRQSQTFVDTRGADRLADVLNGEVPELKSGLTVSVTQAIEGCVTCVVVIRYGYSWHWHWCRIAFCCCFACLLAACLCVVCCVLCAHVDACVPARVYALGVSSNTMLVGLFGRGFQLLVLHQLAPHADRVGWSRFAFSRLDWRW